jgi:pseudaminic acid synthase
MHGSVTSVTIGDHSIGAAEDPPFIVAELSANHNGSLSRTKDLVRAAADAGADAVKVQTYTPNTMTLDVEGPLFEAGAGTLWAGKRLYELYAEAAMPWEWYPELAGVAAEVGIELFSTPFDRSAVDFLEPFSPPAYKIASFELIDLPLIRYTAARGRPLLLSTGMATAEEIEAAVVTARSAGSGEIVLLRCNSAYPAAPAEMDLRAIPDMARRWEVPVGLSDHTLTDTAAVTAVALGATMLEKHFTLSRADPGPDAAFSLEPPEFARLVGTVREAHDALGHVRYGPSPGEEKSLAFRRSILVTVDVEPGHLFSEHNVAILRPAGGLPPADYDGLLGRRAARRLTRGSPVTWDAVEGGTA